MLVAKAPRKKSLTREVARRFTNWRTNQYFDEDTYTFIEHNRRKWKPSAARKNSNHVVLVGIFDWAPAVCGFSVTANLLAQKFGARVAAYHLRSSAPGKARHIYESFGAKLELTLETASEHEVTAQAFVTDARRNIHAIEDIFKICIEGMPVGDLIHDTYLRFEYLTIADIEDPRLDHYIRAAYLIHQACKIYFARNEVDAVLLTDPGFSDASILHRYAIQQGIPVFLISYSPYLPWKLDDQIAPGDPLDFRNWPMKVFSYRNLPEQFAMLSPDAQEKGREQARQELKTLFSAKRELVLINTDRPIYAAPTDTKVLSGTSIPKIVILLHDMIDCPNCYRHMLFTEFTSWIRFLLAEAEKTPFEWYVKPHPHRHNDQRHTDVNNALLDELKKQFPRAKFLDPKTSNLQIVSEEVRAMFTVHGSAGPEFAYLGVPVVTAGDSPYYEYDFVLHAHTLEQYVHYIHTAGRLEIKPSRTAIEEYHYMRAIHPHASQPEKVDLVPQEWIGNPKRFKMEESTQIYRHFVQDDSAERDRKLMRCIEFSLNAKP